MSLPLEQNVLKLVFIARHFTLSETARSLELPQGTVVTRQRRALGLLKLDLLEEE